MPNGKMREGDDHHLAIRIRGGWFLIEAE